VVTVMLRVVEPERASLGPHWLVPVIEVGLLIGPDRGEPGPHR
jgi:hypothetical protein